MSNDSLGDRMKQYEAVPKNFLMKRTPVILRLDGKAFHTFTRFFTPETDVSLTSGPFSHVLNDVMAHTMEYLVANIQNAKLGYTQSDEISILLTDYDTILTDQWFGGNIQKIVSVASSMGTAMFNTLLDRHYSATTKPPLAFFDCRAFNLPKDEVTNYFIWRQQDTTRNSIQMLARHYFSHKELHNKKTPELHDMLMLQKQVNWNDLDTWKKRGTCARRTVVVPNNVLDGTVEMPIRHKVIIDREIPIFTQNRLYIEEVL